MRNAYEVFVGKLEVKRQVGIISRRWEDKIRMGVRGKMVGSCGLDSTDLGKEPVAGCCEHGNELSGSIKDRKFLD